MNHFLWGKLVLVLVAIVAILQVLHLVLLSRLEARHHQHHHQFSHSGNINNNFHMNSRLQNRDGFSELQPTEVETGFGNLVRTLEQNRVLDSSGEYQVVSGIASAFKQPHSHRLIGTTPDISLVTQCSYDHLYRLHQLSQRWQGPISVAVFAEDHQISDALWKISGLRSCYTSVMHNITFSLVSPLPAKSSPPISIPSLPPTHPCEIQAPAEKHDNYGNARNYPNNLLRNVARRATPSDFILVVDIDMVPSANLRQDFFEFASQRGLFRKSEREDKTVFVVPAFELEDSIPPPRYKSQLVKMVETGQVRPFYSELCLKCQMHTDYETWQREPPSSELAPLFEVLWKDPWEPFYIARNTIPFYDERFKQYGFNRISQVCELHVAGFKFSVLNNPFLVHLGFKKSNSFHPEKDSEQERNRMLFRQFKMELKSKYPESSRRCY